MKLCQFQQTIGVEKNNCCQHRVKLIAGLSQFTKALADFLFVIYLLTLVLKTRNKSYTNTLCFIREKPITQMAHLVFAETEANAEKPKELFFSQRLKKLKN